MGLCSYPAELNGSTYLLLELLILLSEDCQTMGTRTSAILAQVRGEGEREREERTLLFASNCGWWFIRKPYL